MSIPLIGLYPIVDLDALARRGWDPLEFAERLLEIEPPALQLRAKRASSRETLRLLGGLGRLTRGTRTVLVVNDRADLAVLSDAGAVHVGQDDLRLEEVRRIAPGLAVGVSTHTPEELDRALASRPDYVAFGPVFATASKERADAPVGLAGLRTATLRARAHGVPLVAIGGIDESLLAVAGELGIGAAVIGALFPASGRLEDVAARAESLKSAYASGR
ncbi:MAG TPA: thiamine phosphate synthase, partial [Polyangiaceae bacterium]